MTLGWFRRVTESFPDDTVILIIEGDKLYELSGSLDKIILAYTTPEEPDVRRGEVALGIKSKKAGNENLPPVTPLNPN